MSSPRATVNGLDLMTLRLLVASIEEGNLGRAAEREHISISSISRRIGELEARLNVPLLHRHDRGVTPTAAALAVLPRLRDSLGLLDQLVGDLSEHAAGLRGLIRLHAHATALAGALPGAIRAFLDAHRGLEVEIEDASSVDVVHAVRVGTADLGLVSGTVAAAGLQFIPWAEDEIRVILPVGHALAAAPAAIPFAALLAHPFIGMQRDSALLALFRRQATLLGGVLRERARVTGFEAVRKLVSAGLGVSILPSAAIRGDEPLVVRPLADAWATRPLMICVRDLAAASAATRLLVEHLARLHETGDAATGGR